MIIDKEIWFQIREYLEKLRKNEEIEEWYITNENDIFFKYKIEEEEYDDWVKISDYKKIEEKIFKTKEKIKDWEEYLIEREIDYVDACCPPYGFY